MIIESKPSAHVRTARAALKKQVRGQTATEYALLLAGVALLVFAKFSTVMARTAFTTVTISHQVAAAGSAGSPGSATGGSSGGVNVEWGKR